jgi:arylsulfatase A-like enzyme
MMLVKFESDGQRPNVVFIMADDLGYGELGCYGQDKIKTPNIDRLAFEGMRFTQCYAGSCVCAPSRSVLITGLHGGHTPIRVNHHGPYLYPADFTVGEMFKEAGYATGCFGKWGLGEEDTTGHPNHQGFDEFFGYLDQKHGHFYYPYFLWKNKTKFYLPENEGRKRNRYAHDEVHAQAMDFIRRNKDKPMFCYVPYIIPHAEWVAPEDSMQQYRGKFKEPKLPPLRKGYIQTEEPCATFAAMVSRMDMHVGEIMCLLAELGIADNTVVFFTSDNGGDGTRYTRLTNFFKGNGPLRGYKFTIYEGGIRVPMIVRWPGRIKPGSVTDHVCAFYDFMPTAAEIVGGTLPEKTDGISFLPTLLNKGEQKEHEFLYWEFKHGRRQAQAVRMGDFKALRVNDGPIALYNLKEDIGETTNVAGRHPETVAKIKEYLKTATDEYRPYKPLNYPPVETYVR